MMSPIWSALAPVPTTTTRWYCATPSSPVERRLRSTIQRRRELLVQRNAPSLLRPLLRRVLVLARRRRWITLATTWLLASRE